MKRFAEALPSSSADTVAIYVGKAAAEALTA